MKKRIISIIGVIFIILLGLAFTAPWLWPDNSKNIEGKEDDNEKQAPFRFTEKRIISAISDIYGLEEMLQLPEKPKMSVVVNSKPKLNDDYWYVTIYQFIETDHHYFPIARYRVNDTTGAVEFDTLVGNYESKNITINP